MELHLDDNGRALPAEEAIFKMQLVEMTIAPWLARGVLLDAVIGGA